MKDSWICVDANLVIRLVVDPDDQAVRCHWEHWEAERRPIAAPTLVYYEVANALHRYRQLGFMSTSSMQAALSAALAVPLELYGDSELYWRALSLAEKLSLPAAHDAHYLALAELLEGEFWTADGRLAHTVQPALPWVHLVQ